MWDSDVQLLCDSMQLVFIHMVEVTVKMGKGGLFGDGSMDVCVVLLDTVGLDLKLHNRYPDANVNCLDEHLASCLGQL